MQVPFKLEKKINLTPSVLFFTKKRFATISSSQIAVPYENPNIQKLGPYLYANLLFEYNYSKWLSTFLNIQNLTNNKNETIKLKPEIRIYNQPVIATSEAAIKTSFLKDRFITINLIKDENVFNVRYQNKPFMIWIWISTLIIIFGGVFAIFNKTKKNYI